MNCTFKFNYQYSSVLSLYQGTMAFFYKISIFFIQKDALCRVRAAAEENYNSFNVQKNPSITTNIVRLWNRQKYPLCYVQERTRVQEWGGGTTGYYDFVTASRIEIMLRNRCPFQQTNLCPKEYPR